MSLREEAQNASDARRWEFEDEGDEVGGIITAIGSYTGDYGTCTTLTLDAEYCVESGTETSGEPILVYASATVLANKVEEQAPKVGDEIAIVYKGEKTGKSGNDYKAFTLVVKHSDLRTEAGREANADW